MWKKISLFSEANPKENTLDDLKDEDNQIKLRKIYYSNLSNKKKELGSNGAYTEINWLFFFCKKIICYVMNNQYLNTNIKIRCSLISI